MVQFFTQWQLDALDKLPKEYAVSLLTRHSIRELVQGNVASYKIPLRPEGVLLAKWWGQQLTWPVSAWYASPVQRCVDTAVAMAEGVVIAQPSLKDEYLKNLDVKFAGVLVEPGSYVHSMEEAGKLFIDIGPLGFANFHFSHPISGVLSPQEGAHNILDFFKQLEEETGTLTVAVTHDTILAAFVYYLLGQNKITKMDWPLMMEGVFLWFTEGNVHLLWRGVEAQYSYP